jgi:hypothetical protein
MSTVCEQVIISIVSDIHAKDGTIAAVQAIDDMMDGLIRYRRMLTGFRETAEHLDWRAHCDASVMAEAISRQTKYGWYEEPKRSA